MPPLARTQIECVPAVGVPELDVSTGTLFASAVATGWLKSMVIVSPLLMEPAVPLLARVMVRTTCPS